LLLHRPRYDDRAGLAICFADDLRRARQTLDGLMKELGRVEANVPVRETGFPCAYSA
jgi:hypothetical protein